jgi:hypothetical protein
MEVGRKTDALVWMVLHNQEPNILMCRFADGVYQPYAGYPGGHITPPHYSKDDYAAWEIFVWLCERGICRLSNGDGDSCDVDFIAYGQPVNDLGSAHITENSFALALCGALLLATTKAL